MHPNDYTDGENVIDLELGDLPSADMDDIQNMIASRIEVMILHDIRDLDLPFSIRGIQLEINSLDISLSLDLEEEEDECGDLE